MYYRLTLASAKKTIGKSGYPQCKGVPKSLGLDFSWFDEPNSMTNLDNDNFPNFKPNLIFELEEKATLTDVISPSNISAKGLLINDKLRNILDVFNLMEHRYYDATVISKGVEKNYFWLHFKDCDEKYLGGIDYGDSSFYVANLAFTKIDDIDIKSYQDFWEKKMNLSMKHILGSEIKLSESLENKKLDLFYFPYVLNDYLISEKLYKSIIDNEITGFEIKEQSIV